MRDILGWKYTDMNPLPVSLQDDCLNGANFDAVARYIKDNDLSYYYLHWFKGHIPEEYQLKMVEENPKYILYLVEPSEKSVQKAIEKDWKLIGSISNPSRKTQALAIQQSKQARKMILDPDLVVDLMDM